MFSLLDLQKPFEIDIDPSEYAIGVVLLQGGRPICYLLTYMMQDASS